MEQPTQGNKKYPHYVHSPFTLEHNGVKVECNESGKIVITKEHKEDDTFEQIECSASLFNRVSQMLLTTRKKVWKDFPYKGEE